MHPGFCVSNKLLGGASATGKVFKLVLQMSPGVFAVTPSQEWMIEDALAMLPGSYLEIRGLI